MGTPTLLGHLAQFGSFSTQAEFLCTQGLAYLLRTHKSTRSALAAEVETRTGVRIGDQLNWHAEAFQDDRGRPDLEARTADEVPVVKVEAKLGAELGVSQLQSYVADLKRRGPQGVLLVLVPARRTDEATKVVSGALGLSGPGPWPGSDERRFGVVVTSWDDLFDVLGRRGTDRSLHELEQLQAMYRVLSGDYIAPLAGIEDLRHWRERETDFLDVVDQVTRRLTTHHKVYPTGVEPLEHVPEGLEPKGYNRRYVCRPNGDAMSFFSIGVRDSFAEWVTPIWLRLHGDTGNFALIRQRVEASSLRWLDSGGNIWIPLDVPLGVSGELMIEALVEQAEQVVRVAHQVD